MHRKNDDHFRKQGKGGSDAAHKRHDPAQHGGSDPVAGNQDHRDTSKSHLIGDALKSVYRHTLEEEIPDDFLSLLNQLK